jgi:hypothetical protein
MANENGVRHVIRYDVVSGESPRTLAADVEVLLEAGWVPHGSIVATKDVNTALGWWYHQPMVVYGDPM